MARFRFLHWLLLLLGAGALAGCAPEASYRYRMTVYVQTPSGVRSGSGVIEVQSRRRYDPLSSGHCSGGAPTRPYRSDVRGQAVAVDLGGRTLFVLLRSPDGWPAYDFPLRAFHDELGQYDNSCPSWPDELARIRILKRQTRIAEIYNPPPRHGVSSGNYPAFARFANLNDPRTIQLLDRHDLARDLGAGYRLLRVTIQITDDPVTEGIENRLPWLRTYSGEIHPYVPPPARMREAYRIYTSDAFLSRGE